MRNSLTKKQYQEEDKRLLYRSMMIKPSEWKDIKWTSSAFQWEHQVRKRYTGYSNSKEICTLLHYHKRTSITLKGLSQEKSKSVTDSNLFNTSGIATSKPFSFPHLPKLRVNDILRFARSIKKMNDYLLKIKDASKVPDRIWLWNLSKTCWLWAILNSIIL